MRLPNIVIMFTSDFNYNLPPERIGQKPIKPRDAARLLILDKKSGKTKHKKFRDLGEFLRPGDVIVLNNSKVIPARLIGQKETGGKIEIFLLKKNDNTWSALIKGKVKPGQKIFLTKKIIATISAVDDRGEERIVKIQFNATDKKILSLGETPLPPYIKKTAQLADYQTVYAKTNGSVAAPTAGLHFTPQLITKLKKQGIKFVDITLHVGLGTFAPVKTEKITDHRIHTEFAIVSSRAAKILNAAKKSGRRIIACGTTSVRTLEAFSVKNKISAGAKDVNIFIYPGYEFKLVDGIITNFHLPQSTLLMLVSAFAGRKNILRAYQEAINKKYRFYSFGDAMLII